MLKINSMLSLHNLLNGKSLIMIFFVLLIMLLLIKIEDENYENLTEKVNKVILFDIDGTLTDQPDYENEKIIEYCLVNNVAIGICTAGSVYQPDNIDRFDWCPQNLYQYLKNTNFRTFNNVGPGGELLNGKDAAKIYNNVLKKLPPDTNQYGWLKGFVMSKTIEQFDIPAKNVILLDDDRHYIDGVKQFNRSHNVICVNKTCPKLDLNFIIKLLK